MYDFFQCTGCGGFHSTNGPTNDFSSFLNYGDSIFETTGITPGSNFPPYTPYIVASYAASEELVALTKAANNPYALQDAALDFCSTISHEVHETLGNGQLTKYHYFDNTATLVANAYFAEVDAQGNVLPGKTKDSNGHYVLPKLTDIFPLFLASFIAEAGDAVNTGSTAKINGYVVNDWYMANYPTEDSFNCFYQDEKKFDYNGLMKTPCEPYGGLHEFVFLTDLTTGLQWFGTLRNTGPLDGELLAKLGAPNKNYPHNFTYFQLYTNTSCFSPECPLLKGTGARNFGDKKYKFIKHHHH